MNITVKLKHTQLKSLVALLEETIDTEAKTNRKTQIVTILMVKFYKKLKEKTVLMEPREYSFSVGPETALAFVEFFKDTSFFVDSYELNMIQNLISHFDSKTA